jgi:hypothetical protein
VNESHSGKSRQVDAGVQVVTIRLVIKLAAKRFGGRPAPTAVPAE